MAELIYHLAYRDAWTAAERTGVYRGTPDDRRDGFLHFSTAEQVAESAARHRRGRDDVILVAVDPDALGDRLKWEPSRGGDLFPHLYGDLPMSLVKTTHALALDDQGHQVFPPGLLAGS